MYKVIDTRTDKDVTDKFDWSLTTDGFPARNNCVHNSPLSPYKVIFDKPKVKKLEWGCIEEDVSILFGNDMQRSIKYI